MVLSFREGNEEGRGGLSSHSLNQRCFFFRRREWGPRAVPDPLRCRNRNRNRKWVIHIHVFVIVPLLSFRFRLRFLFFVSFRTFFLSFRRRQLFFLICILYIFFLSFVPVPDSFMFPFSELMSLFPLTSFLSLLTFIRNP